MAFSKIRESFGADTVDREITVNGVTEQFKVRRIPFIELDRLRASNLGDGGAFDGSKSAGYRARVVAAAVIYEDHTMTAAEVEAFEDELVIALYKEVAEVNGLNKDAKAVASKN